MKTISTLFYAVISVFIVTVCMSSIASASTSLAFAPLMQAGGDTQSDSDELKIAALQGLLSTDSQRSIPLVKKVLNGNSSRSVKQKALFVLGQIETTEAQTLLMDYANTSGDLQVEAIRMIGVGGVRNSLDQLRDVYANATPNIREAVLQAYLIADDASAVYELASAASSEEEFDAAVRTLGAMNATKELRLLRDKAPDSESLVRAYAIAGDLQSLSQLVREAGTPQQRIAAIRSIGIVGTSDAKQQLEEIYQTADSDDIRDAALQGMIISDHDQGVMKLFRQSTDTDRKRDLLRTLVIMDSDLAIDVIDSTLQGE